MKLREFRKNCCHDTEKLLCHDTEKLLCHDTEKLLCHDTEKLYLPKKFENICNVSILVVQCSITTQNVLNCEVACFFITFIKIILEIFTESLRRQDNYRVIPKTDWRFKAPIIFWSYPKSI